MVYIRELGIYRTDILNLDEIGSRFLIQLFLKWKETYPIKLDEKSLQILTYFIDNNTGSTYRCCKYMNDAKKIKISYKNAHKKVQGLHNLSLIDKTKSAQSDYANAKSNEIKSKTNHGAIYYKLSDLGIFYIFRNNEFVPIFSITMNFLLNHENFFLYKYLLYPYLQLVTLKRLQSFVIPYVIIEYLQRCFTDLERMFSETLNDSVVSNIEKIGGFIHYLESWEDMIMEALHLSPEVIAKKRINCRSIEISENDDEKLLKFSTGISTIYLKMIRRQRKVQIYKIMKVINRYINLRLPNNI